MADKRYPGPSLFDLVKAWPALRRDPLNVLRQCLAEYGDFVKLPLPHPTFLINDPADLRHVLVTNQSNYHKTGALVIGRQLFGLGLLSSEDDLHRKQRRIMQPMFHSKKLATFADLMTASTEELVSGWEDRAEVEMLQQMMQLTLTIVGRACFSIDLYREALEINEALTDAQRHLYYLVNRPLPLPDWMTPFRTRRYKDAIETLDKSIYRIIREHKTNGKADDLLTMLLNARYEDGGAMSERQVRDEVFTILIAGHETTANILAWTWYLLATHPEVERKLRAELATVLNGRNPTVADIPKLEYTARIFSEAMRLYPPVWLMGRRAVGEDTLPSGYKIPARSEIGLIPYVTQRDPRFYRDPERFDPDRFLPGNDNERPAQTFYPFSSGARSCIGEGFARMEAAIILAIVVQRFQLAMIDDKPVKPEPLLTLRPKNGVKMRVTRR